MDTERGTAHTRACWGIEVRGGNFCNTLTKLNNGHLLTISQNLIVCYWPPLLIIFDIQAQCLQPLITTFILCFFSWQNQKERNTSTVSMTPWKLNNVKRSICFTILEDVNLTSSLIHSFILYTNLCRHLRHFSLFYNIPKGDYTIIVLLPPMLESFLVRQPCHQGTAAAVKVILLFSF